jgi:hypothetical protein
MKKSIALVTSFLLTGPSFALADFNEHDAARLVQNFSETVACQVESAFGDSPLQYKAIQVTEEPDVFLGYGAFYVVHWVGDYGCSGGNATSLPQFTVVGKSGFSSARPIVRTDIELPEDLIIRFVTDLYAGDSEGVFHIEGISYGPEDRQGNPTAETRYKIKVNDYGRMEILDAFREGI